MYDILQLNDMLVPELLDIAEQLKIPNAKKLTKQDLVYKILDSQAIAGSKGHVASNDGKRKRIIKASTGITTEEAEVVENNDEETKPIKKAPMPIKKDDKVAPKRGRKKPEEKEAVVEAPPREEVATAPEEREAPQTNVNGQPEQTAAEAQAQQNKVYPARREQQFNIEF